MFCLCVGCLVDNPAYNRGSAPDAGGQTGTTTGKAKDPSAESTTDRDGEGGDSSPESGASSSTSASTDVGTSGGDDASVTTSGVGTATSTGSEAEGSSSSTGGLQPADVGQPCRDDRTCTGLGIGAECCSVAQCLDTCMVPCTSLEECPFDGMGCEHGYCLFPCADTDADCAPWPGATCQHGGLFCEVD